MPRDTGFQGIFKVPKFKINLKVNSKVQAYAQNHSKGQFLEYTK